MPRPESHGESDDSPSITRYFNTVKFGRNAWWHWLLGIVMILLIYVLLALAIFSAVYAHPYSQSSEEVLPGLIAYEFAEYVGLIASFLPLFAALLLFQKYWHRRPVLALLTSASKFRWGYLTRAMIVTIVVYLTFMPVSYLLDPEEFKAMQFVSDIRVFALGLLLTLVFIPFQAAAEEIGVRGYLNQALIRYVKWPWVAFVITSLLFAYLHAANPEADGQMLPYMMVVFIFGMGMCTLLYFEGGLESAIGVHVANNIFAFSIVGYEDPDLPEIALWSSGPPVIEMTDVILETVFIGVVIVGTLMWNRRANRNRLLKESLS